MRSRPRQTNTPMTTPTCSIALALLSNFMMSCGSQPAPSTQPAPKTRIVVAVPSKAGPVEGKTENSDAFIWRLFTEFTAPASKGTPKPVLFETWASDKDTFSTQPHWPGPNEPMDLHASVLGAMKTLDTTAPTLNASLVLRALTSKPLDEACKDPGGAAAGGFPTTGPPKPCVVEQVARNRAQFDYIVNNKLNTKAGLATAYANSFQIDMPTESIAVKGDWVPLPVLLEWIPQLNNLDNIRKLYYTATVNKVEYGLLSMHVSSRQNPNWVWGTFEHQMNPGRCDYIGCSDTFGAQAPEIAPNRKGYNTQYGSCLKTPKLKELMANAGLSPVWENYCLKSSQVDFAAADGTPYALGNTMVEGIVGNGSVGGSSCISCHYYASFGPTGAVSKSAIAILPFNPTGNPISTVLAGSRQFSFNWGVLLAP